MAREAMQHKPIIFVGEKPSKTAYRNGWTWDSGQLAARTLFDALDSIGLDPKRCGFVNLFGDRPDCSKIEINFSCSERVKVLRAAAQARVLIIAMGLKVAQSLSLAQVPHRYMRHPAARGAGRKRALYVAHVREILQ